MNQNRKGQTALIILNITPDSFSDGGVISSPDFLINTLEQLNEFPHCALDFGAESTAPFNEAISVTEEINRFEKFFLPVLENRPELLHNKTLSFDTYKIDTIRFLLGKLKEYGVTDNIVWNDVSGKLDTEALSVLNEYKSLQYVLCHNRSPDREKSSEHMHFVDNDLDIVKEVNEFFKTQLSKHTFLSDRVILDPCFGFSKSFEQNWELIQNIPKVFDSIAPHVPALIGISRKSFLKKVSERWEKNPTLVTLESLHSLVLGDMSRMIDRPAYFRLHDPKVFEACQFVQNWNVGH